MLPLATTYVNLHLRLVITSSSPPESASATAAATAVAEPTIISLLLNDTKQILASHPTIASALFDLFVDIFLYLPVPPTSALLPNGLSTAGYQRLIHGAASENSSSSSGCKNWGEEYAGNNNLGGRLKQLKLKLLDLIAPSNLILQTNVTINCHATMTHP